jgi:protein-disulfide isomerase
MNAGKLDPLSLPLNIMPSFLSLPSLLRRSKPYPVSRKYGSRGAAWSLLCLCVGVGLSGCRGTALNGDLEAQVLQIIRDNPEVVIESVQTYQKEKQAVEEKAKNETAQKLLADRDTAIGKSPKTGAEAGEVLLIEFSDFQCPFCANAHEVVTKFMDKHKDRVTLVYKHFPLIQIHDQAVPAALASWAAMQQGKFWEYHDALFKNQDRLGDELYLEIAKDLKLDLDQFQKDIASPEAATAVQTDLKLAGELGLSGTPTFFMNGKILTGALSLESMEAELEKATKNP